MIKRYIKIFTLLIVLPLDAFSQTSYTSIKNYEVYYAIATRNNQEWLALRKFENGGKTYLLLVSPDELETKIDDASTYQTTMVSMQAARDHFKRTPYEKALSKAETNSVMIQDAGIERGMPKETGISLTADLCPSHRALDRDIFTTIITEFKKVEHPVPVALSITGIWILQHPLDMEWLKQLQKNGEIDITWINHSYNHKVSTKLPLKENFLLEPGTNISYEVLETEKAMLRNGLLPSVFFRFPGLVSDQQLVYKITAFGLIPVGSDAWLAKGQQPQSGSIVLIHGNGNEPVGVKDFINLLKSKSKSIIKKQWLLYDLRESVEEASN